MRRFFLTLLAASLITCGETAEVSNKDTADNAVEVMESDWDVMVKALIEVESRGKADAVGKTNDLGVLQITPIYVKDVNRILGEEAYTLEDRLEIEKSKAMFEIYQSHYNPDKDIKRAIKLHNPRAPQSYYNKVMKEFNSIKQNRNEETRFYPKVQRESHQ